MPIGSYCSCLSTMHTTSKHHSSLPSLLFSSSHSSSPAFPPLGPAAATLLAARAWRCSELTLCALLLPHAHTPRCNSNLISATACCRPCPPPLNCFLARPHRQLRAYRTSRHLDNTSLSPPRAYLLEELQQQASCHQMA